MLTFLVQRQGDTSSPEARAVIQSAYVTDDWIIQRETYEGLASLPSIYHDAVPVGSVEFVQAFAMVAGIGALAPIDYPPDLQRFLGRSVARMTLGEAKTMLGLFVKPVMTKQFEARICRSAKDYPDLPDDTLVWVSEPVSFEAEFRFYVCNANILGYAQYGEADDYPITMARLIWSTP